MISVRGVQAAAERRPVVMVAFGAFLFSTGPVFMASADASGVVVSFWRTWFGVGLLSVLLLVHVRATGRWPGRRGWSWAVRCGVLFAVQQPMTMIAVKRTSVVDVSLMQVLVPVIVAVLAARMFNEHPGVQFRLWTLVALAGAVVVVLSGSSGPDGDPLGMGLAAGNIVLYSFYFVGSKQARDDIDVVPFLWGVSATAAVLLSAFVVVIGESPGSAGGGDFLAAGGIAVLAGVMGHFISIWPLRLLPANIPPLVQLSIPFFGGALAWLFLGQGISLLDVVGGAITLVGVAGALRSPSGRHLVEDEEIVLATGTG